MVAAATKAWEAHQKRVAEFRKDDNTPEIVKAREDRHAMARREENIFENLTNPKYQEINRKIKGHDDRLRSQYGELTTRWNDFLSEWDRCEREAGFVEKRITHGKSSLESLRANAGNSPTDAAAYAKANFEASLTPDQLKLYARSQAFSGSKIHEMNEEGGKASQAFENSLTPEQREKRNQVSVENLRVMDENEKSRSKDGRQFPGATISHPPMIIDKDLLKPLPKSMLDKLSQIQSNSISIASGDIQTAESLRAELPKERLDTLGEKVPAVGANLKGAFEDVAVTAPPVVERRPEDAAMQGIVQDTKVAQLPSVGRNL